MQVIQLKTPAPAAVQFSVVDITKLEQKSIRSLIVWVAHKTGLSDEQIEMALSAAFANADFETICKRYYGEAVEWMLMLESRTIN